MPSTFLSRFFVIRAAVVAALCLILGIASLANSVSHALSSAPGLAGAVPLMHVPFFSAPALLGLRAR